MASRFPDQCPVQCTDDVSEDGGDANTIQTGQEMIIDSSDQGRTAVPLSLQTDAEAMRETTDRAARHQYQGTTNTTSNPTNTTTRDEIVIQGDGCIIKASGLAGAMKPGTFLQVGQENHLVINQGSGTKSTTGKPSNIKPKFPITVSSKEPSVSHLDVVSSHLSSTDWRRLGRQLHLDDSLLDQIRTDFHVEGQQEVNYRMLIKWKQTHTNCTLAILAKALCEIGRGDLADELID